MFEALFHHLSAVSKAPTGSGFGLSLADEFLLVWMKLARATTNQDLAYRFNIACCKVSNIFHQWIVVMAANLKSFICWPEKDAIISNMPKLHYSKAVCIIDCSEIFIQRPSSLKLGPRHILITSTTILRLIHHGDLVIADRGFDVADELAFIGATLKIPPFTKGKPQLSQREVELSRDLSRIRIHVERAIVRLKNYKLLQTTLPIYLLKRPHETDLATTDKIITCAALTNLHPPLIT